MEIPGVFGGQDWKQIKRGSRAQTYLNDSHVLQKRSRDHLKIWQGIQEVHKLVLDNPDFEGMNVEIAEIEEDFFWLLFPRIDSPDIVYPNYDDPKNFESLLENSRKIWPDIRRTLETLRKLPPDVLPWPNWRDHLFMTSQQHWDIAYLKEMLVAVYGVSRKTLDAFPDEPELTFVLSHGDPLTKNTVLNSKGSYTLIDWESLCVAPAAADPAHWLSYILNRVPPSEWMACVQPYLADCAELAGTGEDEFLLALAWFCLREAAIWKKSEPKQFLSMSEMVEGAECLIECSLSS